MPDFLTRARDLKTLRENPVSGPQYLFHSIDPATLPSYPVANDTVRVITLPAGTRIIDAAITVSGDVGAATSTITLQQVINGVATSLTGALAATAAGSNRMNRGPALPVAGAHPVIVQVLVSTAALDAAGAIETFLEYVLPEQL